MVPPLKKAIKVKRKSLDIGEETTVSKAIKNVQKVFEVRSYSNITCMLWYLIINSWIKLQLKTIFIIVEEKRCGNENSFNTSAKATKIKTI